MNKAYKVVVTVPEASADMLRKAMGDAGAGMIGNYSHCSFSVPGKGRFLPQNGANPTIGEVGRYEEVLEERIEVTCEKDKLETVVAAIKKSHPYEEPTIDIYEILIG